jgi:putative NADH-flavin reductase
VTDLRLPLVLVLLDFCKLVSLDLFEVLELLALDEDEARELEVVGLVEPAALVLDELRVEEVDIREDEARDELLETREIVVEGLREDALEERRDVEDDLPRVSKIVIQSHHETSP